MAKVAVLGAAGLMARGTIWELLNHHDLEEIRLLDIDESAVAQRAAFYDDARITSQKADASDITSLVAAFDGIGAVANAASYPFNVNVMEACLTIGAHYTDLGGLFHTTRKQLELDEEFHKAGIGAVLGMGSAPGITNMMAKKAVDGMDSVDAVIIRDGTYDANANASGLATGYAIATIIDEASIPAIVFDHGQFKEIDPYSLDSEEMFPDPIGTLWCGYTLHSEVVTLPSSLNAEYVSFSVGFPPQFVAKLAALRDAGMFDTESVDVRGASVRPRDVLIALSQRDAASPSDAPADDLDHLRVIARGSNNGGPLTNTIDLRIAPDPAAGLSATARGTGIPLGMIAAWMATGKLGVRGVQPPEVALDADMFFNELERRSLATLG